MKRIIFSIDDELLKTIDQARHNQGITRSEYIRAQLYRGLQ